MEIPQSNVDRFNKNKRFLQQFGIFDKTVISRHVKEIKHK